MKLFVRSILWALVACAFFSCTRPATEPINGNGADTTYAQYGTPFANVPLTEDIVMYEVNLRAFSESGDLHGVMDRLDELKALGVNTIWLMPIHPIGEINSVNSPYSVRDYFKVSQEYGDLEDLRMLTDQAHALDMAVIMDWVANHTAWDNPWIANTDWYTQDAEGNIVHPPGTNWYDVADLNFDNHHMRAAMIDAMKYWVLEANIDGYRCDYADGVPFDFWQQAIDTLRAIPGRELILLAEGGRIDHFAAGFDLNWAWDFYFRMIDVFNGQPATILYSTHVAEYTNVPEGRHRLRYTTNHDESAWDQTPMVLFNGKDGAIAASVVTAFMGGAPLLYTGQEVGRVQNVPFFSNDPINWNKNPDMLQAYQQIMQAYNSADAARKGDITNYSQTNVVCFSRTLPGEEVLVIVNMRDQITNFTVPSALQYSDWTNAISGAGFSLQTSLELNNYQYLILLKDS
jgi:glycosidase